MSIQTSERYQRTYAIGYYYGRASGGWRGPISLVDQPLRFSPAYKEGYAAGVHDFLEIDLAEQAEAMPCLDSIETK